MLFKNPSVLYALFALLIPIIIHLFKLRKFQKVAFTNVAMLEKIKMQTRKSSQIKKWLVLLSRLLLLICIILAFAEPFLPSKSSASAPEQYIIYLDNSFSMEAKGGNGPLLKRAIQELIEQVDENQLVSFFTNNEVYKNIRFSEIQNELIDIDYVAEQLSPKQLSLKFKQLAKNISNSEFIAISDFQKHNNADYSILNKLNTHLIKVSPQEFTNVSVDSLWTEKKNQELILNIKASSNKFTSSIPLSVYNGENLIGKAQLDFSEVDTQQINIPLPKNVNINGYVQIEGNGLAYDNKRYFSINKLAKTKILAIGNADAEYLKKIYTEDEFEFFNTALENLNYAQLSEVNNIVLNELEALPKSLQDNLLMFVNGGGVLTVIPSAEARKDLKSFLKTNFNIELGEYIKQTRKLTQISFEHPVFNNVFTKKINNFQYPTVNANYNLKGQQNILLLEGNSPFLIQNNNVFVFASPLNSDITNFKQSPIIVPCLYNIAKQNSSISKADYIIGATNKINIISTQQSQEDVLQIKGGVEQFIPLQQIYKDYVQITTSDLPKTAGNYSVYNKDALLSNLSFNYTTKESILEYVEIKKSENININNSVSTYFSQAKAVFEITELWKWFLIFALIFIGIEIILLKFLK